jgi:branched-chain amino acid transport system ATP-binding protein
LVIDALWTEQLVSGYGRVETLHGVDIQVPVDGVTAIVGPNGSGKSTLLKTIMGLVPCWRGKVIFDNQNIAGLKTHNLARRGLCMVPQGRVVFPMLSVQENLLVSAFSVRDQRVVRTRLEETYQQFPALAERRLLLANNLSGGEQAMLALARATMLQPRVLLLDEPSLGLSPKVVNTVYEQLMRVTASGVPTLIVEQNVRKVLEVAGHVIVLVLGRVRFQGSRERLEREVDLERLFLGADV